MASSDQTNKKPDDNNEPIEIPSDSDSDEPSTPQANARVTTNAAATEVIEISDSEAEEPSSSPLQEQARVGTDAAATEVIETSDSDAQRPSPSPSQEQERVAAILAAADGSTSAVSSVRDESNPAHPQPSTLR